MIYGIGTDLVDLDRIKKMKSISAFANKILGDQELVKFGELADGTKQFYLGKQFAGKEAFVKALGTGFKDPVFPNCLLYTSPSPRDRQKSRMPSSA